MLETFEIFPIIFILSLNFVVITEKSIEGDY